MPPFYGYVPVGKLDLFMFLNGKDDGVALKILWNKSYEPASLTVWKILSESMDLVFDIGAHTGIYSIVAAKESQCKVISLEPMALNIARLVMNKTYNNLSNINPIAAACSHSAGKILFNPFKNMEYLTSGNSLESIASDNAHTIETTTIDNLSKHLNRNTRLLVKVDVEGHEHHVLRGALKTITSLRPIFLLECIEKDAGQECTKILNEYEYQYFNINEINYSLTTSKNIYPELINDKPNMGMLNKLIIPKEKVNSALSLLKQNRKHKIF
jgi:FkbM family methyltransferase